MGRKSKACLPCHSRKVRCDAGIIGSPCSRCANNGRAASCTLISSNDQRKRSSHDRPGRGKHEVDRGRDESEPQRRLQGSDACAGAVPLSALHGLNEQNQGYDDLQTQSVSVDSVDPSRDEPSARTETCDGMDAVGDYHEGTHSLSILNEVLHVSNPNALSQLTRYGGEQATLSDSGLDEADFEYLRRKQAWSLPPRPICDQMLRLFFEQVYAYAPVFDRINFVQEYRQKKVSIFLLQAILASVAAYVPLELLKRVGFEDNQSAQRAFFTRAKLLHDAGVEKSQLRLLQGSLFLCLSHISRSMDKDYRYWLSNAARIVIKMGLHRETRGQGLDLPSKKLFRRIWWTVYSWDMLLALHGLDSVRRFHYTDFDIPNLTEGDWLEEAITSEFSDLLPPISRVQTLFQIQGCKLLLMASKFWQTFPSISADAAVDGLDDLLDSWQQSLPPEMRAAEVRDWSSKNLWVLYLAARRYVCECVLYRILKKHYQSMAPELATGVQKKLSNALFELDTVINRLSINQLDKYCPWFMYNCACTALALNIEMASSPIIGKHDKLRIVLRIHSELEFLRELSKQSSSNQNTLKIFEAIIRCTNLALNSATSSISVDPEENTTIPLDVSASEDRGAAQFSQGESEDVVTGIDLWPGSVTTTSDFFLPFDFDFGLLSPNQLGDVMSDPWIAMD